LSDTRRCFLEWDEPAAITLEIKRCLFGKTREPDRTFGYPVPSRLFRWDGVIIGRIRAVNSATIGVITHRHRSRLLKPGRFLKPAKIAPLPQCQIGELLGCPIALGAISRTTFVALRSVSMLEDVMFERLAVIALFAGLALLTWLDREKKN
jgi:hypothetical protein